MNSVYSSHSLCIKENTHCCRQLLQERNMRKNNDNYGIWYLFVGELDLKKYKETLFAYNRKRTCRFGSVILQQMVVSFPAI